MATRIQQLAQIKEEIGNAEKEDPEIEKQDPNIEKKDPDIKNVESYFGKLGRLRGEYREQAEAINSKPASDLYGRLRDIELLQQKVHLAMRWEETSGDYMRMAANEINGRYFRDSLIQLNQMPQGRLLTEEEINKHSDVPAEYKRNAIAQQKELASKYEYELSNSPLITEQGRLSELNRLGIPVYQEDRSLLELDLALFDELKVLKLQQQTQQALEEEKQLALQNEKVFAEIFKIAYYGSQDDVSENLQKLREAVGDKGALANFLKEHPAAPMVEQPDQSLNR